ncbi:HEAT repeat domain-containing protein [bacterium]|nr:HEAT repeat domain-containing protein [bacterium]
MKRYLIILLVVSIVVVFLTGESVRSKTKDELGIVIDKIVKVLKYGGMTEKADAATALGIIGDSRAVEPLIEFLKYSKRDHLRSEIAEALGRIGDKKATPALIETLLNDSYHHTRCAAARALGIIGDKRAIPALEKALKDEYYYTRWRAAEALKKLTGKDYTYEGKKSPAKEIEEMMKKIKEPEKELPKQK